MRVVFCTCFFFFFFFALDSFSVLSYSLYRCVNCFSMFVLFVRMEIIIIIIIAFRLIMVTACIASIGGQKRHVPAVPPISGGQTGIVWGS